MGCFNTSCCFSGLPIGPDDDVKHFFMTRSPYADDQLDHICSIYGLWFPRTVPIDAKYNSYGSIHLYDNHLNKPIIESIINGFKLDLIEISTGNNVIHDISIRKDNLSFEKLLEAVIEGRLKVKSKFKRKRKKKNVNRGDQRFFDYDETKNGENHFLIDDVGTGWVRIRVGYYASKEKQIKLLKKLLPVIEKVYAGVITAGMGSSNSAELQVFPLPIEDTSFSLPFNDLSSTVCQGMILSSVWDEMIKVYKSDFGKNLRSCREIFEQEYERFRSDLSFLTSYPLWRNEYPYSYGVGNAIQEIAITHCENPLTDEQLDYLINNLAGFEVITNLAYKLSYWWRPTFPVGPQSLRLETNLVHTSILAKVSQDRIKQWEKEYDEEYEEVAY